MLFSSVQGGGGYSPLDTHHHVRWTLPVHKAVFKTCYAIVSM